MFYALSKTLDLFASPLTWALLFAVVGPLLARSGWVQGRWPRLARWSGFLPIFGGAVLYVFSIEPVSNAIIRSLEAPLPVERQRKPDQVYDAVVVLGGLTDDRAALASGLPSYNGASERMHAAFEILRENKAKTMILSGGTMYPESPSEAELLRRQLERWGADLSPVIVEGESRNTKENALFSARILKEKGAKSVLVVTSAFHMKRALACFEAAGIAADGYPVDFRGYDPARSSGTWLPRSGALFDSTWALHEHVGRLVYALRK